MPHHTQSHKYLFLNNLDKNQHFESVAEPSIGLYPVNTLGASATRTDGPTSLPGFETGEAKTVLSSKDGVEEQGVENSVRFEETRVTANHSDKGSDRQDTKEDDMDISEKSDSRSVSSASTKKSTDMDCTVTSDEEEGQSITTS